jgi:hypothetical protein
MKTAKILFWTTTIAIFLFEGVLTALTSHTALAINGITHLGYPVYFATILVVFKVVGSIVLVTPRAHYNIKEWAYAGFGIDFICALVSNIVIDGFGFGAIFSLFFIGVLIVSYTSYHKLLSSKSQ